MAIPQERLDEEIAQRVRPLSETAKRKVLDFIASIERLKVLPGPDIDRLLEESAREAERSGIDLSDPIAFVHQVRREIRASRSA